MNCDAKVYDMDGDGGGGSGLTKTVETCFLRVNDNNASISASVSELPNINSFSHIVVE